MRFAFADRLRPDAAAVIAAMKRRGLGVELLSGDRAHAVARVADDCGLADWRAEVSPAGKAERLAELARGGRRVLMVGDGLNDAPALAAAHASVSPATASEATQNAADAVFQGESLGCGARDPRGFPARRARDAPESGGRPALQSRRRAARHRRRRDAADRGRRDVLVLAAGDRQCPAAGDGADPAECPLMDSLLILIPAALTLGLLALAAFLWALRHGQFDDPEGAAGRILFDDEDR